MGARFSTCGWTRGVLASPIHEMVVMSPHRVAGRGTSRKPCNTATLDSPSTSVVVVGNGHGPFPAFSVHSDPAAGSSETAARPPGRRATQRGQFKYIPGLLAVADIVRSGPGPSRLRCSVAVGV